MGLNNDYSNVGFPTVQIANQANGTVTRVTAGAMAPGQTSKQYVGKAVTSTTVTTTVTLETVTTGKTFYVTDIVITSDSAQGASTTIDCRLQSNGVDIFRAGVHNLSPVDCPGLETQPFATSGSTVTFLLPVTTATQNVWYNFFGYEQ